MLPKRDAEVDGIIDAGTTDAAKLTHPNVRNLTHLMGFALYESHRSGDEGVPKGAKIVGRADGVRACGAFNLHWRVNGR
jgi:hypothetical protein